MALLGYQTFELKVEGQRKLIKFVQRVGELAQIWNVMHPVCVTTLCYTIKRNNLF